MMARRVSTFISTECYLGQHDKCPGIVPARLPAFAFEEDLSPKSRCECAHHRKPKEATA